MDSVPELKLRMLEEANGAPRTGADLLVEMDADFWRR